MTPETSTAEDRKAIGLPIQSFQLLEELVDRTPWFDQQLDAYRVAISVALAKGWQPSNEDADRFETKFAVSTVDPDRTLREIIGALAPESGSRPYDYSQRLALAGVKYLHQELIERGRSISEVLGIEEDGSLKSVADDTSN